MFEMTLKQNILWRTIFDTRNAYLFYTEFLEIELFLHFTECKRDGIYTKL